MTALRIIRSDGAVLQATERGRGWLIADDGLDGFGDLSLTVSTTDNVITDGSSVVSKRVNEKDRTATLVYVGSDARAAFTQAERFFNPKRTFRAYLTYMGVTRWCEGELSGYKSDMPMGEKVPTVTFTLLCPDPYWRDEIQTDKPLDYASCGFGFPFVSHMRELLPRGERRPVGFIASKMVYGSSGTIYNSGNVETNYIVRITASGEIANPKITKDGRFVRVLTTMHGGDVLDIDFESSPPRVTMNGINVINLCDRNSTFMGMQMACGPNEFEFSCDNEENVSLARVQVIFHKKWLGV